MPSKMPPEKIDRMAEQFVGVGGHRDIPTFGFDADLKLKPLKGIEIRLDELPPAGKRRKIETPRPFPFSLF